jgi:hypothetical protein
MTNKQNGFQVLLLLNDAFKYPQVVGIFPTFSAKNALMVQVIHADFTTGV